MAKITKKQIPSKYFPIILSKTSLWGLTPAVSFQKILYFGAWPQH